MMTHTIVTGDDTTISATAGQDYFLEANNTTMLFLGTNGDALNNLGSHEFISGMGNNNLAIDLTYNIGNFLTFGDIRGQMTIKDFNPSDTLVLRNSEYATNIDAVLAIVHHENYSILPLGDGASIRFVGGYMWAGNLQVTHT